MVPTRVQGGLVIDLLQNGDNLNTVLMATKPLYQTFKKGTDDYSPNWATASESDQPVIYPRVHSVMEGMNLIPTDCSWRYNGVAMEFNSSGTCTRPDVIAGKVKRITHDGVEALRLIENLASDVNNDSDTFGFTGYADSGGQRIEVNAEITVLIEEAAANLYRLFLNMDDDIIDGDEESITMTALLYNQGAPISRGVEFEFLDIEDEVLQSKRTSNKLVITRSMIDSELLVVCRAYVDDKIVAEERRQAWDSTDPYTVVFSNGNRVRQSQYEDKTHTISLLNARNGNTVSGATFDMTVYRNSDKQVITSDFTKTSNTITVKGTNIFEHKSIYIHVKASVE